MNKEQNKNQPADEIQEWNRTDGALCVEQIKKYLLEHQNKINDQKTGYIVFSYRNLFDYSDERNGIMKEMAKQIINSQQN